MSTARLLFASPPANLSRIYSRCRHSKRIYSVSKRSLTSTVVNLAENNEGKTIADDVDVGERLSGAKGATPDIPQDAVQAIVSSLTPEQRTLVLHELHKLAAVEVKNKAEEKLASWRWRSRFGRPTSLHQLGADPTGTYCAIPQDWLQKKVAEKAKPMSPTARELRNLGLFNALPFVGFGFLDNLIMIVAGDYIDVTIGMGLGISTMAAAALGNTVSDLAGIGSAWYVENIAVKIGLRPPLLSQEQLDMFSARWSANLGRGLGVVIGCLLGMFPLMFLSNKQEDRKDRQEGRKDTEEEKKDELKGTVDVKTK